MVDDSDECWKKPLTGKVKCKFVGAIFVSSGNTG
ncbi:hypothetical protein Golob_008372 [Gossypium lobatum]|uniref:Uncharacterized protein n=1 Tax=Gossypium lobatum TaxID=34289 RepID=A0A7J8MFQ0_9ROSI|nr:hypothetical protein [Gossypium lobatum]